MSGLVAKVDSGERISFSGTAFDGTAKIGSPMLCVRTGLGDSGVKRYGLTTNPLNDRYSKLKMRISKKAVGPVTAYLAQNYHQTVETTREQTKSLTHTTQKVTSTTLSTSSKTSLQTGTATRSSQYTSSTTLSTASKTSTERISSTTSTNRTTNRTTVTIPESSIGNIYYPYLGAINNDFNMLLHQICDNNLTSSSRTTFTFSSTRGTNASVLKNTLSSSQTRTARYLTKRTTSTGINIMTVSYKWSMSLTKSSSNSSSRYGSYDKINSITNTKTGIVLGGSMSRTSASFTGAFSSAYTTTTTKQTTKTTQSSSQLQTGTATRSSQYTSSTTKVTQSSSQLQTGIKTETISNTITQTVSVTETKITNNANL